MARKLRLVKGASHRGALVYGMRIFDGAHEDGSSGRVTMHYIEGTRDQIRRQLMHSIDAFFELLDEHIDRT